MAGAEKIFQLLLNLYPRHSPADALHAARSELREDGLAAAASWTRIAAEMLCARAPEK